MASVTERAGMTGESGSKRDAHEPAGCELLYCQRRDDYGDGYSDGKAKVHAELLYWTVDDHAPSCGCQPCQTAWGIVARAASDLVRLSAPHEQGCGCPPCRRFEGFLIRLHRDRPAPRMTGMAVVESWSLLNI